MAEDPVLDQVWQMLAHHAKGGAGRDTPPRLGENNIEILCGIGGLTPEELVHLESEGAL